MKGRHLTRLERLEAITPPAPDLCDWDPVLKELSGAGLDALEKLFEDVEAMAAEGQEPTLTLDQEIEVLVILTDDAPDAGTLERWKQTLGMTTKLDDVLDREIDLEVRKLLTLREMRREAQ